MLPLKLIIFQFHIIPKLSTFHCLCVDSMDESIIPLNLGNWMPSSINLNIIDISNHHIFGYIVYFPLSVEIIYINSYFIILLCKLY